MSQWKEMAEEQQQRISRPRQVSLSDLSSTSTEDSPVHFF